MVRKEDGRYMSKSENVFSVFSAVSKDIAIDLGTANTVVYMKDRGIVLREPSVVAINEKTEEVVATGKEARDMMGRTPENVSVVYPVRAGAIAEYGACTAMLKYYIKKSAGKGVFNKPRVVVSVPSGISDVERRAIEDSVRQTGAGSVSLMEAPLASAIGAGLTVGSPRGSMILSMGAGMTECAVISMGDVVASASRRGGSGEIDRQIVRFVKKNYGLNIGLVTAEELKIKIGSIFPTEENFNTFMEVKGRSVLERLPKSITVHDDEIRTVFHEAAVEVVRVITETLELVEPELSSDIMEGGITLVGGGSGLRGISRYIEQETGLKVKMAERPLDCTAEGIGKSLDLVFAGRDIRKTKRIR